MSCPKFCQQLIPNLEAKSSTFARPEVEAPADVQNRIVWFLTLLDWLDPSRLRIPEYAVALPGLLVAHPTSAGRNSAAPRHGLPLPDLPTGTGRGPAHQQARRRPLVRREADDMRTRRAATVTTRPETPPPQLLCPKCDKPLVYRQTILGGMKPSERYDQFHCHTCGPFEYRHRTRLLRAVPNH